MPLRRQDTQKALQLMEECRSVAGDERFRVRAEKLLTIFQSDLFQALLDIQEFYELTVSDNQLSGHPSISAKWIEILCFHCRTLQTSPPGWECRDRTATRTALACSGVTEINIA